MERLVSLGTTLTMTVQPFRIDIPESALEDLRRRLAQTRWPDEVEGVGWDYGTSLAYLKDLVAYWQSRFDWRAQERWLNSFPHFHASISGLRIHFIHIRGRGKRTLPLVLTHGWPGSFIEMLLMAPLLADDFDLVIPSLPGYGFSERPRHRGMTRSKIAAMWNELMTSVLGYERYGAHGGDIGSGVTTKLAQHHADHVLAIHLTAILDPTRDNSSPPLTSAEREYLAGYNAWLDAEGGYWHIQRTKPQTLAYGLNDSPAGLAAWIIEKYRTWSDCGGNVESRFSRDLLLTIVSLYWFTETINSSIRLYIERARNPEPFAVGERIGVPTAVTLFPNEFVREAHPPREYVERVYNLVHYTSYPRGGHFPALEEPELLAEELRDFFARFRS